MVKSKEELLEQIRNIVGDDVGDSTLELIENVSDTIDSLGSSEDSVDWQAKYNELDIEWRKKYKERFFNNTVEEPLEGLEEPIEEIKIDDLFKEEE